MCAHNLEPEVDLRCPSGLFFTLVLEVRFLDELEPANFASLVPKIPREIL